MAGTFGPITTPDRAWRSGAARSALHRRDAATILRLAQQYGGTSQHRLARAVGIPPGRQSEILKRARIVIALEVFERISDGLTMPDHARLAMGLARRPNPTNGPAPSLGEVVDMFSDQADASHDVRTSARNARYVQVLAVRGLGLVGLKDALLRDVPRQEVRLRIVETGGNARCVWAFKGAMLDAASTPDYESVVDDADAAHAILTALGLEPVIAYTKQCQNFRFTVDNRDIIGTVARRPEIEGAFLEVETLVPDDGDTATARAAIRAVLGDLGLGDADLEPTYYIDLVRSGHSMSASEADAAGRLGDPAEPMRHGRRVGHSRHPGHRRGAPGVSHPTRGPCRRAGPNGELAPIGATYAQPIRRSDVDQQYRSRPVQEIVGAGIAPGNSWRGNGVSAAVRVQWAAHRLPSFACGPLREFHVTWN